MKHKITVWGLFAAGILWIIAGLRDIFAPGFFNVSPQVASNTSIIVSFGVGTICLALGWWTSRGLFNRALRKR
jgi:hypothetical protein